MKRIIHRILSVLTSAAMLAGAWYAEGPTGRIVQIYASENSGNATSVRENGTRKGSFSDNAAPSEEADSFGTDKPGAGEALTQDAVIPGKTAGSEDPSGEGSSASHDSSYFGDIDVSGTDTEELRSLLSELTDILTDLELERTGAREELQALLIRQSGLEKQEEEKRESINEDIRIDYERTSRHAEYESLTVSSSSDSYRKDDHSSDAAGEDSRINEYQEIYQSLHDVTSDIQNRRLEIRQLDSRIALFADPADRIGAEIERRADEKAAKELAEKQAAAGTLTAVSVREYLGSFVTTGYCPCEICCGEYGTGSNKGLTASGTAAEAGRTAAMGGVPFGTKLEINGIVYTVEDRGTPYGHVDIYYDTHDEASAHGLQHAEVYLIKE